MTTWGPSGSPDPNQPNFGQNPGQQPPYGQNPGQQPPYGQNPGQQPPYGQNPGQQPPYGQNPGQQPPYGQPPQGGQPPQFGQQPQFGPPGGYPQGGYGQGGQFGGYQGPAMPPPGDGYGSPGSGQGGIASMGARFGGLVIDTILIAVVGFILGLILGAAGAPALLVDLISVVIGVGYWAYFVGVRTQTLGHRAVGIKVVNVDNGSPIGPGMGVVRYLVLAITGAICTLGYWSPFFDSARHRGWHDKASGSIALNAR